MIPSSHESYDVSMRRHQALEFLGIDEREHKQIFSHMIYGLAGVEEGTLIVQGDHILARIDWEAFPSWEKLHICSSITRVVLDKEHVKEQSLAWARAFLHELTALSFGRRITCIDPYIISLPAYGKILVCTFADLHTLIIMMQCRVFQRGRFFMLLHEQNWAKLCDGDSHILYGLGQVLPSMYVQHLCSATYHASSNVRTYIAIHELKNNLPYHFSK